MGKPKIVMFNVKCRGCNKFYPRETNRRYCKNCDKRMGFAAKRKISKEQYWKHKEN